jgi:hypothetical protein
LHSSSAPTSSSSSSSSSSSDAFSATLRDSATNSRKLWPESERSRLKSRETERSRDTERLRTKVEGKRGESAGEVGERGERAAVFVGVVGARSAGEWG